MLTVKSTGSIADLVRSARAVYGTMVPYAAATALTRSAKTLVSKDIKDEMKRVIDRPTPYTLNSLFSQAATKNDLSARVGVKDAYWISGTPPENFLFPNMMGGLRPVKRYEKMLRYSGYLPGGMFTAPGIGANLDPYGNISKGQLGQILSQLKTRQLSGFESNMSARSAVGAQRRAGGRFFVIPKGRRAAPGVYQREFTGKNITPVLMFIKAPAYKPRMDFHAIARRGAEREFPVEFSKALRELIARGWNRDLFE